MAIEILSINENEQWPKSKQTDFEQLKVITARVLDKNKDLTNGFTEDLNHVVAVYARYANDEAKSMCWNVCKKSPKYDEQKLQAAWDFFTKDNQLKSNNKLTKLCKNYDIDTTLKTDGPITDADELAAYLPAGVDPRFVLEWGFYAAEDGGKCGYYFKTGEKTFAAQSNFIMQPLMHVYSKGDNKRIISISNGFKKATLDMPSRAMISLDQFSAACYDEGNFMFWGSKIHLMRILSTINDKFPQCFELKTLGWQPEGFFAWSNYVYIPAQKKLDQFNDLGIAEIDETNYFSPAASSIYRNQRAEDDEYENDRFLSYKKSSATLEQWAVLFDKVYPGLSIYGIGFVFIGLFKDVIYKIDNNCPHLSAYGEKGSGKSKFAESISAIFLNDLQPFNLNHGTDFAFFNRLSRFKNCVTWFDEFDDAAIKEDRFQSIKGAYDGAGRERGKGTNKNRTEIAKVNSALLLTGQYLSTRDDNAALSRCIILPFTPNNDRSHDAIKNYEALKVLEKKGLTSLVPEILIHREDFAKAYPKTFPDTFSELRELINKSNGQYKERVLRNYTAIANIYKYFSNHLKFPFTLNEVMQNCAKDVIRLSTLISESDSLADFWNTVEYLMETGEIYEGYHFRITQQSVLTINKDGKDQTITLQVPKKILYIRLTTIHKLYLEAFRKQTGKTGINKQSLELYIGSAKGYHGKNSSQRFTANDGSSTVTSSYVFDYDLLGVPLERSHHTDDEKHLTEIKGHLVGSVELMDVAGKPKLKFSIKKTETYKHQEEIVKKEVFTTVYAANLQFREKVETGQALVVTGVLKESEYKNKDGIKVLKRTMDADLIELHEDQISFFKPMDDAPSFD
jgi:hypothetical protein